MSAGDVDGILAGLHDDATWWVSGTVEGSSGTYTEAQMGELLAVTTTYADGDEHADASQASTPVRAPICTRCRTSRRGRGPTGRRSRSPG